MFFTFLPTYLSVISRGANKLVRNVMDGSQCTRPVPSVEFYLARLASRSSKAWLLDNGTLTS